MATDHENRYKLSASPTGAMMSREVKEQYPDDLPLGEQVENYKPPFLDWLPQLAGGTHLVHD